MIEFLTANWLWIVLVGAMLAMHRGGCGSHGSHGRGTHGQHQRPAGSERDHLAAPR